MLHILNLTLPTLWQSLSEKQLRFVFTLLARECSLIDLKVLCFFKWAGLRVHHQEGNIFICSYRGKRYPISALQVTEALASLSWLDGIPPFPVRLSRIGFHRAVRADFQDVSFEDFLTLDNLYQGYLQTQREDLLVSMAKIMYRSRRIRLNATERVCVFYWFSSVKQMFGSMFPHFLKSVSTDDAMPARPSYQQLRDNMNTQIRALTGGDITKEREVLSMDCWRALTELDAKAKDYEDMKKASKS